MSEFDIGPDEGEQPTYTADRINDLRLFMENDLRFLEQFR